MAGLVADAGGGLAHQLILTMVAVALSELPPLMSSVAGRLDRDLAAPSATGSPRLDRDLPALGVEGDLVGAVVDLDAVAR